MFLWKMRSRGRYFYCLVVAVPIIVAINKVDKQNIDIVSCVDVNVAVSFVVNFAGA